MQKKMKGKNRYKNCSGSKKIELRLQYDVRKASIQQTDMAKIKSSKNFSFFEDSVKYNEYLWAFTLYYTPY